MFAGMLELMESCNQFHMLTERKEEKNYREQAFIKELRCRGKDFLLQKIIWTEIPAEIIREISWEQLFKHWLWGTMGDSLRERYWMNGRDGTDM